MFKIKKAFTLAEMMVVMLILSIIMAAMAPVMTTRNKLDQSSPWQWAVNGSDAYFVAGTNSSQTAMIGQNEVNDTDPAARLIINSNDSRDHLLFKMGNNVLGKLSFINNSILLGRVNGDTTPEADSIAIGRNLGTIGSSSIAIGNSPTAGGDSAVAIGSSLVMANHDHTVAIGNKVNVDNSMSIGIGYEITNSGTQSIAIGNTNTSAGNERAIAIGTLASAGAKRSIAIGSLVNANGDYSTAIGDTNTANNANSISIGKSTTANGESSIAMGNQAETASDGAIALGYTAKVLKGNKHDNSDASIAIGYNTNVYAPSGVAIGRYANVSSDGVNSIAIGESAQAGGGFSIAIGDKTSIIGGNALSGLKNSVAIGHQTTIDENSYNSIAIGSNVTAEDCDACIAIGNDLYLPHVGTSVQREPTYVKGNTAVAIGSLAHADGWYPTAIGAAATAGDHGTAVGRGANAAGKENTAIGYDSCDNTTGTNVTCIGANSGPESGSNKTSYSDIMYLGDKDTTVYIPGKLVVDNSVFLNAVGGTIVFRPANARNELAVIRKDDYEGGDDNLRQYPTDVTGETWWYNQYSDRRLKYVENENTSGLDKIKQLKVFNYTFKKDEKKIPHVGVIAQDLQKVFPEAVSKAKDGFLRIRFEDMFYAMINAIKELDSRLTALEKENQQLKEMLKQVQNDNKELKEVLKKVNDDNKKQEARLKTLEAKIK